MAKNALGLINHVAFVLDASGSMSHLHNDVIRVADEQIRHLAECSKELDQETRVTVYVFHDDVKCAIYDKDVLRLPSIREYYKGGGMTALIDATLQSQDDLAKIPEIYADHSFLTFVITDGLENRSKRSKYDLEKQLKEMPDHWSVAILVPDRRSEDEAVRFGFPVNSIAKWDASSKEGLEQGLKKIQQATDTYMTNRAMGIRGTREVFSTGAEAVNKQTIRQAGLVPLGSDAYVVTVVPPENNGFQIKDFVNQVMGYGPYKVGKGYYELMKREKIQGDKQVAIREKKTGKVYTGANARLVIGLGDEQQSVFPDFNPEYKIFVQSRSVNRKVVVGQEILYLV